MLQKTGLLRSEHYGRLFIATRCAELIDAGEFDGEGPIQLQIESRDYPLWDGLVETRRSGTSRETIHGWQVKHQRTPLDKQAMAAQLRQLAASSLHIGHLAMHSLEPIKKIGSLQALADLCDRLRQPGIDLPTVIQGLTNGQRKWVEFAMREVSLPKEEDCLRLFQRLDVRQLGPTNELRDRALKDLRRWYEDPNTVLAKLLDFLAQHPDEAVVVDYPYLRDRILEGHTPSQRRGQTFTELRKRYLHELVKAHERLAPLKTLVAESSDRTPSLRLMDVFVPPLLRQVRSGSRPHDSDMDAPQEPTADASRPGDPRWSRLRRQQRAMSLQRKTVDLTEWLLSPDKLPARCILIEGAVGAGKSLLLEHLRQTLAREGLHSPTVPLPILLNAQDLSRGELPTAFRRSAPLSDDQLLHEDGPKRIYFVDGLDEVAPQDARTVASLIDQLSRHKDSAALILTSRPSTTEFPVPPTCLRLRLSSWAEQDIERFLERWRRLRPEQVDSLGSNWRQEPMRSALANPLTATFCLMLSDENPDSRKSRTALFGGIVSTLFQDWVRFRHQCGGGATTPAWSDVSKALQKVALEVVRAGRETLGERDIRQILRRIDPDRDRELMEAASLRLGLLVRQGRNEYRFILRGIAEYLAGMALLRQGVPQILAVVRHGWAEEPVRHAIGILAEEQGTDAAITLLDQLLSMDDPRSPTDLLPAFRGLLVAARAALDLGTSAQPLAKALSAPLLRFLTTPDSSWMPERVSEVIRDLAHAAGPCWDALFPKLLEALMAPGDLTAWFAGQQAIDWSWWKNALSVSDPKARALVTARLAQWSSHPEVREALVLQLFDDTAYLVGEPVAPIVAGLALREAPRDEMFTSWVQPTLKDTLRRHSQLASGSAALALRPGEADPKLLVEGVRDLNAGYGCPPEVLAELAASPDGKAALDALWPDWLTQRQDTTFRSQMERRALPSDALMPLASTIRPIVLRTMGPELARMPQEERRARGIHGVPGIIATLCEEAVDHPEGAISLLMTASNATIFHIDAQLALRDAAIQHSGVARALLALWDRADTEDAKSRYPGFALEHLVAAGDDDAAHAFASWIKHTPYFRLPAPSLPLTARALRHPRVLPVARCLAWGAWKKHAQERLWIGTAGTALGSLRPAWEDDEELNDALRQRTPAEDDAYLSCVLSIYWAPPFPNWLRELLVLRLKLCLDTPKPESAHYVPEWLEWAECTGDIVHLRQQMEDCIERISWERYSAATHLLEMFEPREAAALSKRMAADWPSGWSTIAHKEADLARLVVMNPQSWHERVKEILAPDPFGLLLSGFPVFELVRALLPRLPIDTRGDLLMGLRRSLGHIHHPWLSTGHRAERSARRPADFFSELLFERGSF